MEVLDQERVRRLADDLEVIEAMRGALLAAAAGECETPLPMHLGIPDEEAEIHVKSSYQRGGRYYAVKIAAGFPRNVGRGLAVGSGLMFLASARTGEPVALLAEDGYLTDLRTAAVAALMARELGRGDRELGILGSGVQARLQARLHARVLDLGSIVLWGRTPERVEACRAELAEILPGVAVAAAATPAEVARRTRLLVTVTASRAPLLAARDLQPGTLVSAVGSDSPGKQELDPDVLEAASLLLVDSLAQCERLGELQHAPRLRSKAVEAGVFLRSPVPIDPRGVTVCDFTGLGVEDLFVARTVFEKARQ